MRTYVVLAERVVYTDVGDTAFVLLGFYDATSPGCAARLAASDHGLRAEKLTVVPSRYWR